MARTSHYGQTRKWFFKRPPMENCVTVIEVRGGSSGSTRVVTPPLRAEREHRFVGLFGGLKPMNGSLINSANC